MSARRKTVIYILCAVILALWAIMIFGPIIAGWNQQRVLNEAISKWEQQHTAATDHGDSIIRPDMEKAADKNSRPLQELWDAMDRYNREIYTNGQDKLVDAWSYQASVIDLSEYGLEGEPVGVISIPAIDVEMLLYLGATYDNMAKGFAQLSQTSMPIGGENTNCVVAGHRGWQGAAYMRDADLLEIGDIVYLQNLWETMEYRVCEIKVISPDKIKEILIQPGRDLVTIVTCTPYGVGSHRLLIICERYIKGGM